MVIEVVVKGRSGEWREAIMQNRMNKVAGATRDADTRFFSNDVNMTASGLAPPSDSARGMSSSIYIYFDL